MNTWLSDQKPLLSLIFNYLDIFDLQKWRNTSKTSIYYSDASISPKVGEKLYYIMKGD